MDVNSAEGRAIVEEIFSCRAPQELHALLQRRPAAASPLFQQAMATFLEPRIGTDWETFAIHYFDGVVTMHLPPRKRRRQWPWMRRRSRERIDEAEIARARSRSEVLQALVVLWLNSASDAEFAALLDLAYALETETNAQEAWQLAKRVAGAELHRLLNDAQALLEDGEWSRVPLLGDSVTSLRRVACNACASRSWLTFWNYIGLWDWERRKQLYDGELNALWCRDCGSSDVEEIAVTAIDPALRLASLPSFVCCETERSLVFRVPHEMRRPNPQIMIATHALIACLARRSPRGKRSDLDGWDLTFDRRALRRKIRESSVSVDPSQQRLHFTRTALVPLAVRVRAGALDLDPEEPEIANAIADFDLVAPRGFLVSRTDYESRDPLSVTILALLAFLCEQTGHFVLASLTYTAAAEEAVSAARWGEVSWLAERAERAGEKAVVDDEDHGALLRGARLQRASLHFAVGEVDRAAREMLEIVDEQRDTLAGEKNDLRALLAAIDLAGSLDSAGDHLVRRDLATGRRLLLEAIELCGRIEHHPQLAGAPQRSMQYWRLTRSGALNNFARSCQEIRQLLRIVVLLGTHAPDDPKVSWYFEDGVTIDHLKNNLEAIRKEFPQHIDPDGRLNAGTLESELNQTSIDYYRRALMVSEKYDLHRYAALQWSNLSRVLQSTGDLVRAAECGENAEREARAAGHLPAIVEASLATAGLHRQRGANALARTKLVAAYELWARMRRSVVFDDLRIAAGRQIEPILDRIASTIDDASADEWIATLERMKAGSLADSLLAPPLRLADLPEDEELKRLRQQEMRIVAERERAETSGTRKRLFRAAPLVRLEQEHEALVRSLLLRRPYLGGDVPDLTSAADYLRAVRARYAGVTFVGMWLDGNDLLVYGIRPDGHSFAFRHSFLPALVAHVRIPMPSVHDYLGAYRATAAADLPPDNLAGVIGGPWFRALWEPIEQHIGGAVTRAVLSPHAQLRGFPWATMWTGDGWMVQRTTLSEVVTVTGVAIPHSDRPQRVLILADPDLGDDHYALPGARAEAETIESLMSNAGVDVDVRIGSKATRAALFEEAPRADVIHLACHGTFDGSAAWKHALHLSGRDAGGTPATDAVTMQQIAHHLRLKPGALVVLSACETAKAQYRAADEAAGLARSFHLAGASNVIAALWPVEDEATAALMSQFYHWLSFAGASPADALALAQRDLILMAPWGNPSQWGAFVVYER